MPHDRTRLRESVLWSESQPRYSSPEYVAKPVRKIGVMGTTSGTITANGGTGSISEMTWDWTTSTYVGTGATLTVRNFLSTDVGTGKKVFALFIGGDLHVVSGDC